MSTPSVRTLRRFQVGGLPLLDAVMRRMRVREIFAEYLPGTGRDGIAVADVLGLLVVNLTVARDPLYELAQWAEGLDLRALGFRQRPAGRFSDDRLARALDKLYLADRATLMTRLVVAALEAFEVQFSRIHNDSTSVKAFGRIPGRTRTGLELRNGHSKDHRPDLKQLVFSLSIAHDGAVPVHHRVYPGNRNDETTHIETWEALRQIHGAADFLYVADCKLCTREQLAHIVGAGGRAITILPQNLLEVQRFKEALRAERKPRHVIWRRPIPGDPTHLEYFSLFAAVQRTDHGGYPIYWYLSTEKRHRDELSRQQRLEAAETALAELAPKVNGRRLKRKPDILRAATAIVEKYHLDGLLNVRIAHHCERWRQRRRGRPGKRGRYRYRCRVSYSLHWTRDAAALRAEARTDGVFPLLCTDPTLPAKSVLQAYKFQPRLEKRFCQFKSIHGAAPLLFKKIHRVEANMFVFFVALMVQALLERHLRQRLAQRSAPPLKLYPEDRDAPHPTTSQLLKTFEGLSTYAIIQDGRPVEEYRDQLSDTHRTVLALMDMTEEQFWAPN
jgi:transposase